MGKKLSVIRFKPKPEHYETFLNDVIENGKDRDPQYPHFCVRAGDEVIAVVIRDADNFEQSAQEGVVNWLAIIHRAGPPSQAEWAYAV